MMKRIVFLLMILCLLPCAALAADGDLPDVEAFSNGLVEINQGETEVQDYMIKMLYNGTDEDVLLVANEYIALLTEKYGMKEICHFPISDENTTRVRWAFEYTKSAPKIGTSNVWNDNESWRINGYQVFIEYSQSDYYASEYVMIYYRPEFNYIDTGDRIPASTKPTAKHTAKPTAKPVVCPECDGTGDCPECGGDMWVTEWEWVYVNGSPESKLVTDLCDGIYCYGGSCDKCGGDGVL